MVNHSSPIPMPSVQRSSPVAIAPIHSSQTQQQPITNLVMTLLANQMTKNNVTMNMLLTRAIFQKQFQEFQMRMGSFHPPHEWPQHKKRKLDQE